MYYKALIGSCFALQRTLKNQKKSEKSRKRWRRQQLSIVSSAGVPTDEIWEISSSCQHFDDDTLLHRYSTLMGDIDQQGYHKSTPCPTIGGVLIIMWKIVALLECKNSYKIIDSTSSTRVMIWVLFRSFVPGKMISFLKYHLQIYLYGW